MRVRLFDQGGNCHMLQVGDAQVLFSYSVPVAFNDGHGGFFKSTAHFSSTTSKHVNAWLRGVEDAKIQGMEQSELENLVRIR